ncbi:hypothetical protein V5E38_14160 [Rossellomorea sp. GAMAL-10_SWC]
MKYLKLSVLLMFSIIFLFLFFYWIKDYSHNKKVVAQVNKRELSEKELQMSLNELYKDITIKRKVNEMLIQEEIERRGYKGLNKEEFKKAKKYYSLVNNIELKDKSIDSKLREKIKFFYFTLLIIKKDTVTEEELYEFWNKEKNNSILTEYQVKVHTDKSQNKLKKIENDLALGISVKEIEAKYNIHFQNQAIKQDNPLTEELSQLRPMDYIHTHNYNFNSSAHTKDSHKNQINDDEGSHAIIILENIINSQSKSLENDKDEIIDYYITKNIYKEKIELINLLKGKYKVKL